MNTRRKVRFVVTWSLLFTSVVCVLLSSIEGATSADNFRKEYFGDEEAPYKPGGRCREVCAQLGLRCRNLRAALCESQSRVSWAANKRIKNASDFFIVGGVCERSEASNYGGCFDSEVCLPDGSGMNLRKDFNCVSVGGEETRVQFTPETIVAVRNETVRLSFIDGFKNMTCKVELRNGTTGSLFYKDRPTSKVLLYYLRCLNTWDCRAKYGSLYRDDWSEYTKLTQLTPRVSAVNQTNGPGIYFCRSEKWNVTLWDEIYLSLDFIRLTRYDKANEDNTRHSDRNIKRDSDMPDKYGQYYFDKTLTKDNTSTTFRCQATTMMYMGRFVWTLRLGRGLAEEKRFGHSELVNYTGGIIESNLTVPTDELGPEYFVRCNITRRDSPGGLELSTPIVSVPEEVELSLNKTTPTTITCSVKSFPHCKPPTWTMDSKACNTSRSFEEKDFEVSSDSSGKTDTCSSTLRIIPSEWWHQAVNCTLRCTSNPNYENGFWGERLEETQIYVIDDRKKSGFEPWHVLLILVLFTAFFGSIILMIFRWKTPPLTYRDIERYVTGGAIPKHFKNFHVKVERIVVDPARNFLWSSIKLLTGEPLGAGNFGVVNSAVLEVSLIQDLAGRWCIKLGNDFVEVSPKDVLDGRLLCCVKRLKTMTGKSWREMLYDVSLILTVMGSGERWKNRIIEYYGYHMCHNCPYAGIVMRKYQETLQDYILRMRFAYVLTSDLVIRPRATASGYSQQGVIMTDADLVKILIDVAKGMVCLKNLKIVHGDLKPDNVFCIPTPEAVGTKIFIGDFGQAKIYDPEQALLDDQRHLYLRPPEDLHGSTPTEKTDVWAFGMLAMHLFDLCRNIEDPYRGRAPKVEDNETSRHHFERHMIYLIEGNRAEIPFNTPFTVRDLINDCWSTKPEDRPGFDEILARLRVIMTAVSETEVAAINDQIA